MIRMRSRPLGVRNGQHATGAGNAERDQVRLSDGMIRVISAAPGRLHSVGCKPCGAVRLGNRLLCLLA